MKPSRISILLITAAFLSFLIFSLAAAQTDAGATFTVTATSDVVDNLPGDGVCETAPGNGMCTLRAAIMEANALIGADTILLPEATYDLTILGADEDACATGDLDITEDLTILGSGGTITMVHAFGLGDRVLDVYFGAGSVSISGVYLSGGEADNGGGIRNYASLELTDVTLASNEADFGGGIYSTQVLDLVDVSFHSNSAIYNGGGMDNKGVLRAQDCHFAYNTAGADGGAAYLASTFYQSIADTGFANNSAENGAGIYNESDLTLGGLYMDMNTATSGGGIYNTGNLTIQDASIYQNTASTGAGIHNTGNLTVGAANIYGNTAEQLGGGIYNEADLTIADSDLYDNNAMFGAGIYNSGVLVIENSELTRNIVSQAGGGIYNHSGNVSLENVGFVENSSTFVGGGILNSGGSIQGYDLLFDLNSSDDRAGAIQNTTSGQVELHRATFSNNQALNNCGAIENSALGYFILIDSTIIGNNASAFGGGIMNGASFELIRVTVTDNQAASGAGIANDNATLMNIENSTISGNAAELNGGGIYNAGTVYVFHSTITGNDASADPISPSGSGGGVFNMDGADFYFSDTILFGNYRRAIFPTDNDCSGTLTTGDYNLLGTLDDCTLADDQGLDLIGVDPLLGTLADNGGPTQTRALQPGSPAIDAADPAGCYGIRNLLLTIDQRGHPLPWDGDADGAAVCDIGAYEAPLALRFLPFAVK